MPMSRGRKGGRRIPPSGGGRGRGGGGRSSRRGRHGQSLFVDGGWLGERPTKKQHCSPPSGSGSILQAARKDEEGNSQSSSECYDPDSSIDSDIAEDYIDNVGAGFSVEELAREMETMYKEDMDFMDLDLTDGDDECDTDNEDDSDLEPTQRILFREVDSGYSSEDEEQPEEDGLLREEVRLQNLDIAEEGVGAMIRRVEDALMQSARKRSGSSPALSHWQKGVPGEKKRHRKELIAAKRRDRAMRRGVDLQKIKLMFDNMIAEEGDMLALEPMENKDRAMVHKLATTYGLKTGSQGAGKKRFIVVTRTERTCLPTGADFERLQKMLGVLEYQKTERALRKSGEQGRLAKKYRRAAREALGTVRKERRERREHKLEQEELSHRKAKAAAISRCKKKPMRELPLNFVSCGVIEPGDGFVPEDVSTPPPPVHHQEQASTSTSSFGHFEAHTKGFGSRMLARMGFVEGSGLGKEGQGMTQPLQAKMRPKSLGLGAKTL